MSKKSSNNCDTFIDACVRGEAMLDEIDDWVDRWHESDSTKTLAQYLGMNDEEYRLWVGQPSVLRTLAAEHALKDSMIRNDREYRITRTKPALAELSAAAKAARKPLPPEDLVDAQNDRVHRDRGRTRAARSVRSMLREIDSTQHAHPVREKQDEPGEMA